MSIINLLRFFAGQQRTFSKFGLEKVQQKIPRILSKLMDSVHWTQIENFFYKILKPEKDTQFCLQNFIRPNFYNLIFIMPVYGAVCVCPIYDVEFVVLNKVSP